MDDEEDVRESLRDLVELWDCSARKVSGGREALELLRSLRPGLIILDLMMPGMNGAVLVERLRENPALCEIPLLMCTSAPERAPRGVPMLAKPIDLEAFKRFCSACVPARPPRRPAPSRRPAAAPHRPSARGRTAAANSPSPA